MFFRLKEFGAWYGNLDGIIMSIAEKPGCTTLLEAREVAEGGIPSTTDQRNGSRYGSLSSRNMLRQRNLLDSFHSAGC
jgi:hypothetical protein